MRPPITTHILDTQSGTPAADVEVRLSRTLDNVRQLLAEGKTNDDGRVETWSEFFVAEPGVYQIEFAVADYFHRLRLQTFYPSITIVFEVTDPKQHYHVPLLLSAYGYSTYRGS